MVFRDSVPEWPLIPLEIVRKYLEGWRQGEGPMYIAVDRNQVKGWREVNARVPRFYLFFCIYLEEFETIQGEGSSYVRRRFSRKSDAFLPK